jgi:hypothetical protein
MSSTQLDTSGVFDAPSKPTIDADHVLHLNAEKTLVRHNGIEFHHDDELDQWTEMTVDLHDPVDGKEIKATGVVVSCQGDRHRGFRVSMVLMNLSEANSARLSLLAYSSLA